MTHDERRDMFAAHAMVEVLRQMIGVYEYCQREEVSDKDVLKGVDETVAKRAFELADAMIKIGDEPYYGKAAVERSGRSGEDAR